MNQVRNHIIFIVLFSFLLHACTKNENEQFVPYNNAENDTTWQSGATNTDTNTQPINEIARAPMVDSFQIASGKIVSLQNDSIQIAIPGNSLINSEGGLAQGGVKIEIILLRKRGDFIRFNRTSLANVVNAINPLAMLHVRVLKNGQELSLHPNAHIVVKLKETVLPQPVFTFVGRPIKQLQDSIFTWIPYGMAEIWDEGNFPNPNYKKMGYELELPETRWTCVGTFNDTVGIPRGRINAILPLNFTNKNTIIYALPANKKTTIRLIGDIKNKLFYANGIPKNAPLTIVSISKIGSSYYLGNTTVSNTTANPVIKVNPEAVTLKAITEYLDKLN